MEIENIAVPDLAPYTKNSRTHTDKQIAQIAKSITEFGFANPVLIDAENMIIAGHGRVLAAEQLGLDYVPCIRLAHLSDAQKRAYAIVDNKLTDNSSWDDELLAMELDALQEINFDLDLLGFDDNEIQRLFSLDDLGDIPTPDVEDDSGNENVFVCQKCGYENVM